MKRVLVSVLAAVLLTSCSKQLETENAALKQNVEKLQAERSALASARDEAQAELAKTKSEAAATRTELEDTRKKLQAAANSYVEAMAEKRALRIRSEELEQKLKQSLPPPSFELTGDVFIATKGGTSYKLGAVAVDVFSREDIDAWINARTTAQLAEIRRLEPLIAAAAEAEKTAKQAADASKKKKDVAFKAYLAAISDRKAGETYKAEEKAHDSLFDQYLEKRRAHTDLEIKKRAVFATDFYFDEFPKPVNGTKTNADGRFKITLDRAGKWVVAAMTSRAVGKETEQYFWLVPVENPPGAAGELTLSNGNLSSVEGGSLIRTMD